MNLLPPATRTTDRRRVTRCVGLSLFLAAVVAEVAGAQADRKTTPAQITTQNIVRELVERNSERAARLKFYSSERHYHLEYTGFPHHAEATLDVEATCTGPTSKSFRVLSESGSHFLVDHILKRLLISEQQAARIQDENALTPANYRFRLIGSAVQDGHPVYELTVEPRKDTKYLYRGEIWVDAKDYAVTQIEAEPAKSLSFWVRKVDIHHVYLKTGNFWLPQWDRSETKVRFGGTAILTIDYGTYNFTPRQIRTSLSSEPAQDSAEIHSSGSELALRH